MTELTKAFVSKADGNEIIINILDSSIKSDLLELGFSEKTSGTELELCINGADEKAQLFAGLRDLEVSFSDGKEWCPSEVFEYLRDASLIAGTFKRISWTSPGNYHLTEM